MFKKFGTPELLTAVSVVFAIVSIIAMVIYFTPLWIFTLAAALVGGLASILWRLSINEMQQQLAGLQLQLDEAGRTSAKDKADLEGRIQQEQEAGRLFKERIASAVNCGTMLERAQVAEAVAAIVIAKQTIEGLVARIAGILKTEPDEAHIKSAIVALIEGKAQAEDLCRRTEETLAQLRTGLAICFTPADDQYLLGEVRRVTSALKSLTDGSLPVEYLRRLVEACLRNRRKSLEAVLAEVPDSETIRGQVGELEASLVPLRDALQRMEALNLPDVADAIEKKRGQIEEVEGRIEELKLSDPQTALAAHEGGRREIEGRLQTAREAHEAMVAQNLDDLAAAIEAKAREISGIEGELVQYDQTSPAAKFLEAAKARKELEEQIAVLTLMLGVAEQPAA